MGVKENQKNWSEKQAVHSQEFSEGLDQASICGEGSEILFVVQLGVLGVGRLASDCRGLYT